MATYGLIGRNISYSFSKAYFEDFFEKNNLPHTFINFDIADISKLPEIISQYTPHLKGLSVTIPYKKKVLQYLDAIDEQALAIGAVNSIKIDEHQNLIGYNTDVYGFKKSLEKHLFGQKKALVLGSGGASLAVRYVLESLEISYWVVSRFSSEEVLAYKDLNAQLLGEYQLIINCTPLGSGMNIEEFPLLPYKFLTPQHLLFDLVYNPSETLFLKKGKEQGARVVNGLEMLFYQAEKSWELWN